jgi:hypothetical protein
MSRGCGPRVGGGGGLGTFEIGPGEVAVGEGGLGQVGPLEVDPAQVAPKESGAGEVHAAQAQPLQVHPAQLQGLSWLIFCTNRTRCLAFKGT